MDSLDESSGTLELSGMRILLVEDSWPAATALSRHLKSLGAEVSGPVATSADALRLLSGQQPDAALVDFNLRGGELADALVERLLDQGIHVVVITGYTELPKSPRQPVAILHKPFSEAELLGSLRPLIARRARA